MSLVIIAVTAAVAASLGFLASRRRDGAAEALNKASPRASKGAKPQKAAPPPDPLAGLNLALGDVVSAEGEERWLAGVIVARERATSAAVFIAPEGLAHRAVVAFPAPQKGIFWLAPVEVASTAEPPATLEIEGTAMHRRGRLPVTFERLGQGTPNVGASGILATYEAGGREVAILITSEGKSLAWSGRKLDEEEFDRMGRVFEEAPT
jgi:hypothetical protein